jgi:hypothetical protein
MILFLEILAFSLTALCVYHSLKYRGKEFTLLFFITGFVLGIVRENIVSQITDLYSYNPSAFTLWIGSAPLLLGVFWSYTIYFSLSLSEYLFDGSLIEGKRISAVILSTMAFMAAYACLNESFASIYRMVIWRFVPDISLWGGTPLLVPFGYAGMALIFLLFIWIISRSALSTSLKLPLMIASVILMVPLHLAWIGIVRLMLKIFMRQ